MIKPTLFIFVIALLCIHITGCAVNDYVAFYSINTKALPYVNQTKVQYPFIDELIELHEVQAWRNNNYEIIGTSSFSGLWCSRTNAIDAARKHGAEIVLVHYKLKDEKQESTTFIVPQATTTYHYGTIYGHGSSMHYHGSSTAISEMPVTINYTNRYYDQKAFFLAKRKKLNNYGVYFQEPENIPGKNNNVPVVVDVVIVDSPAEKAGIKVGDIVDSINGQKILSFDDAKPFMLGKIEISTMEVKHE